MGIAVTSGMDFRQPLLFAVLAVMPLVACAPATPADDFPGEAELDDRATEFDKNNVLSDEFYLDVSMTVGEMEQFLETGPYFGCQPVWLRDEVVDGQSVAKLIVEISADRGVNPLMVLARMQVEQSLISKAERPANTDYALGCHDPVYDSNYPNGKTPRMAPFDVQLECATETLMNRFRDSVEGKGHWVKGVTRVTGHGESIPVTPANHATAALYAYTPFVGEKTGGNWLVWSVTTKYERHLQALRDGTACR